MGGGIVGWVLALAGLLIVALAFAELAKRVNAAWSAMMDEVFGAEPDETGTWRADDESVRRWRESGGQ